MKTHAIISIIAAIFMLPLSSVARRPSVYDDYARKDFVSSENVRIPYRILSPQTIVPGEKYPLVIFLHGSGERGADNEKQLIHGASIFSNPVNAERFPAFVVFPQCKDKCWTGSIDQRMFMPGSPTPDVSKTETSLMELVSELSKDYPVDADRIYMVGISMGGIATFDLACRYPNKLAAAVPICGAVNPERLSKANDVNFMIFHGEVDEEVPVFCSREAYKALNAANANVEYVEFSGVGHECWDSVFNYTDFLPWLFSQTKNRSYTAEVIEDQKN